MSNGLKCLQLALLLSMVLVTALHILLSMLLVTALHMLLLTAL